MTHFPRYSGQPPSRRGVGESSSEMPGPTGKFSPSSFPYEPFHPATRSWGEDLTRPPHTHSYPASYGQHTESKNTRMYTKGMSSEFSDYRDPLETFAHETSSDGSSYGRRMRESFSHSETPRAYLQPRSAESPYDESRRGAPPPRSHQEGCPLRPGECQKYGCPQHPNRIMGWNTPCSHGQSCNRPDCLFDHSLDAGQRDDRCPFPAATCQKHRCPDHPSPPHRGCSSIPCRQGAACPHPSCVYDHSPGKPDQPETDPRVKPSVKPSVSAVPDRTVQLTYGSQVAVFWDLENCGLPGNVDVSIAVNHILSAVRYQSTADVSVTHFAIYGEEKCFHRFRDRVFEDEEGKFLLCDDIESRILKSEIRIHWFSQDDKASVRKPDEADKRMLVDMCLYAMDKQSGQPNQPPIGIALVSSDVDFGYAVRQLTTRGIFTLLIHGRNSREDFKESAIATCDWYSLVRGIAFGEKISRPLSDDRDYIAELEMAIDWLLEEKVVVSDMTVRSRLRLDGRSKDDMWNQVKLIDGFQAILTRAQEDQKEMKYYDPHNANWDNFTVNQLRKLYDVILKYPNVQRNGKYPMACFFQNSLPADNPRDQYPTGLFMEFVELAIRKKWIIYDGKTTTISPSVLQKFPAQEIFEGGGGAPSVPVGPAPKVARDSAKSALQFYFQKCFKSLPTYECSRSGPDHFSTFHSSVQVPLPERYVDGYFYATGESTTKKDAEKVAALNACEILLTKYVPDFQFPDNYLV